MSEATMVERVAIALYQHEMDWPQIVTAEFARNALTCAEAVGEHSGDCTNEIHTCMRCEREKVMAKARAAIAAMREPTELMCNEGWDAATQMVVSYGFAIGGETPVWHAMIDAALAERGA